MFAILLFSKVFSQKIPGDSLYNMAKQGLSAGDYPSAIGFFQRYLDITLKQKDSLNAGNALIGIGIAYDKSGDFEQALQHYFKALKIYDIIHEEKKQAGTLKNIGNTYRTIKSYSKANAFFNQARQKFELTGDSTGVSNVLNDIGIMYMDQDSNRLAIACFKMVSDQYKDYAVEEVRAYALNNMAIIYSRTGDYTNAYNAYHASLIEMQRINEQYGAALVLTNLGDLFNKQGDYRKAIRYSSEGLAISEKIRSKELIASAYRNLAESYRTAGEYDKSISFLNKLIGIRDTLFEEKSVRSYAEMETRYQNEKKQKEIAVLTHENTIKNIELVNQQRTKYFLLSILAFISLIVFLLYRSNAIRKRSNMQLNTLNKKLDEANHSKTKLLSIISHDLRSPVSSLFSFISLQKKASLLSANDIERYNKQLTVASEHVLEAMEDLLVWSKSQMDNFNSVNEVICLSDLFEEIINLNTAAAAQKNIQLIQECPSSLTLDKDPNFLKVIIRNLTSNAIKFNPENGIVRLTASSVDGRVVIAVSDNGPGIPPDQQRAIFEWSSINSDSSGLGLKLAKEFTEKLHGSISLHSGPEGGSRFLLSFPAVTA